MTTPPVVPLGLSAAGKESVQLAAMMNRHGLVAGATGTGKTVTLQVLAEGLSQIGVPVFTADIKGDLSGLAEMGKTSARLEERLAATGILDHRFASFPVAFWDLFGQQGTPVRMTVSEMGPLVLARLLQLNDTQTGVLYAAFKIADDQGLLILDLDDLRSLLTFVGEHAAELKLTYGNLSATSIGAIQRNLLVLDSQGASGVFGEPALALKDLMQVTPDGRGVINLLDATRLARASDVTLRIDSARVPVSPLYQRLQAADVRLAVSGGEDYVLLFTAATPPPFPCFALGEVLAARPGTPVLLDDEPAPALGWDHFA